MKTSKFYYSLITVLFFLFTGQINAQIENIWIGGCPGHETEWDYFKNWSSGQVPDWSSDVIIPEQNSNKQYYPKIENEDIEINSLYLKGNAKLTINENSSLAVYFTEFQDNGILNQGELSVEGQLICGNNTMLDGTDDKYGNSSALKKFAVQY